MPDKLKILRVAVVCFLALFVCTAILWKAGKIALPWEKKAAKTPEVSIPTIVNGELVLPKIGEDLKLSGSAPTDLGSVNSYLSVLSVNLVGIYSADPQSSGSSVLSGVRILGEAKNMGNGVVTGILPVARFIGADGTTIAQKLPRNSTGYDFYPLDSDEPMVYDLTVDGVPPADRLELVLNTQTASDDGMVPLKIASKSATPSSVSANGQNYEVYTLAGSVVNTRDLPVSDIAILGWVKDKDGKVYGVGRQDFPSDLISPGEKIDFKILVLPVKGGESLDSFAIRAWGKEYHLK